MTLAIRSLYSRRSKCSAIGKSSRHDGDGGDQPPILRLVAMGGATVAEEPFLIGIGAQGEIDHPAHSECTEPRRNIARQIEHPMAGAARGLEEPSVGRVQIDEAIVEFRPHFI